jgi:hypothetical protein
MRTFWSKLSICTYSSNEKLILFPVKFTDELAGLAFVNIGGNESLNPPWGGTMLAQPELLNMLIEMIASKKRYDIIARCFMQGANLKAFV